jgi:hypothetical protein
LKEKQIFGKVQNGVFFPERFIDKQVELLKNYFEKNASIDYDLVKTEFYAPKAKQFLTKGLGPEVVLLQSCGYRVSEMNEIPDRIESLVEENGYAETFDIFPANFTDKDIEQVLEKELGLPAIIFENGILLSEVFLGKCVDKIKDRIVKIITENPQKTIAGKGSKKSTTKKAAGKDSAIMSDSDVLKYLEEEKMIEYITDEDAKALFLKHIQPKILESYDRLKIEYGQNKTTISVELMNQITTKVNHLGFSIAMADKSIRGILQKAPDLNESIIEKKSLEMSPAFLEQLIFLSLKKHGISIQPDKLAKDDMTCQNEYDGLTKPLFVGIKEALKCAAGLPLDLNKMLKDIYDTSFNIKD